MKIDDVIDDGDYYGAQQMYKSVSSRYSIPSSYGFDRFKKKTFEISMQNGLTVCDSDL